MMIVALKLFITPVLIGSVTLAGRLWGPVVSGLMIGLPLTTGPVSFILAHEYGLEFARKSAAASLAGQASMCVFCLVYSLVAKKCGWLTSAVTSLAAFLMATLVLNRFSWHLVPAFIVLLVVIALVGKLIPHTALSMDLSVSPAWDLPARMIIAVLFVLLVTTFAQVLGPQLSGLISPFPVFGVVLASFTHSQRGADAAANLLHGIVIGSLSFAAFFLVVGLYLTRLGISTTYGVASAVALAGSAVLYVVSRKATDKGVGTE